MYHYWENRFSNEGAMWKFQPSDSALYALDLFKAKSLRKILVPGFGYGRNARVFIDNGMEVTGIEISQSAVLLAKKRGLNCKIHCGSVTSMPFDNEIYDGIFCYALLHLLNKTERRLFLGACINQLRDNGIMSFIVASTQMSMYGTGKFRSKNRYEISKGLKVYFYDKEAVQKEFSDFGLISISEIEEPVKYMKNQDPIKLIQIICQK